MRLTQNIIFDGFMKHINQNRMELSRLQEHIASGKKITTASDSPVSFKEARNLEHQLRDKEFYQQQINQAKTTAQTAQQSLDEVVDRLIELKGIVVRGGNNMQGTQAYQALAQEVESIQGQLIHSLNSSDGRGYVFAGTASENPPFVLDATVELGVPKYAGGVRYDGTGQVNQTQIEDGVYVNSSVTGESIREVDGIDLFETIQNTVTALKAGDSTSLSAQLDDYDSLINHLTNETAKVAFEINKMDFVFERQESIKNTIQAELSSLVDTDFAETFSQIQQSELAFQSAMTVHSSIMNQSLLEYL